MLPNKNKLKGKKEIETVKAQGGLYQMPFFGVCLVKREDGADSRFAFVVSTKVAKDAVQRNRIVRAMRSAVRYNLAYLKKNFDLVILAKKEIAKASTEDIMNEVKLSFKKLKIL